MERIFFTNSRGLSLVGNLYRTKSDKIIIFAHGYTNDKSSQGRFDKLAHGLIDNGFNVLAFDFSGCGESDSDIIRVEKQVDDLKSAVAYVKSKGYCKIGLFGNSLGSLICLKAYDKNIETMVLLGALTDGIKYDWKEHYSKDQLQALETKGYFTLVNSFNRTIKIGKGTLADFEDLDQKTLLSKIKCPVLIIHGNGDEEELALLSRSKNAMDILPINSQLILLEGAKHGFHQEFMQVVDLTCKWFLKNINK